MNPTLVTALLTGIGVAAATGLRAFLPLFAVGLAGRFGLLELRPGVDWLAGDAALWALGTATVLEIVGDKIPAVDHALDTLGTVVRPAAAVVAAYAVLDGWGAPWAQLLALVLGAGTLGVHFLKSSTRVGSTAFTFGLANPFLSILEDLASFVLLLLAILLPALAVALVLLVILLRRRRPPKPPLPAAP